MQKINQIVILNGGIGSRVKSIAKNLPKCLIEFRSKSFLFFQLRLIKEKGIKDVVICCGYKSNFIINELKKKYIKNLGLKISVSIEKRKLGTGGAILNANKYLHDHFFITYGDSWLDINYKKIANELINSKYSCIMTVIKSSLIKNHKSNIALERNKIVAYNKNNSGNKIFRFIDYGLLVMKKKKLLHFKNKKKFDLSLIISYLINNNDIKIYKVNKKFYHIGSLRGIQEIKKILV
jgi:N-acetyl-alpha-D-muramate 1-phosphate uridylyltransferase